MCPQCSEVLTFPNPGWPTGGRDGHGLHLAGPIQVTRSWFGCAGSKIEVQFLTRDLRI